jgi:pimeloyl-ACP methyl ester carboxylesterase
MTSRWVPDDRVKGDAVLLHGLASLAGTWWRIGPGLAQRGWRTHAIELAGHGGRPRLPRPLDMDLLADEVIRQLAGPVDLLVGHSLGAVTALAVATRRPDVARALVLEDPPGPPGPNWMLFADDVAAAAALVRADRDAVIRQEREANPTWRDEDVRYAVDGIAAHDVERVVAGLRGPLGPGAWDPAAAIAALDLPVLLIVAPDAPGDFAVDGGSALRGEARAAVRAAVPAGRFVVMDGGHCLHRDLPDAWLDTVTAFADEVLQPG